MKKYFSLILILLIVSCAGKKESTSKQPAHARKESPELTFKKKLHKAFRLKLIGKYLDAQRVFEECLALQPNNDGVNFALSELSAYKKDFESAIQFGEKANELNPKNKWYSLNLALLYQQTGDYKKASESYEKALVGENDDMNIWFAYSDALIYSNDLDKAIEAYNQIEKKMGVIPEISLRKHQIYVQKGQSEKAEAELKNLIATNPKNPQFHGMLAEYYMRKKEYGKAKAILDKMLEMDSTSGSTHLLLADYYTQQGMKFNVQKHVKEAFLAEDLEIDTKMRILVDNYERIGQPGELGKSFSYQLLDALVKTHPDDAKVYAIYGDYDQEYKNIRGARDNYLKSTELDKTRYPIWNQLLLLSANLTDYDTLYKKGKEATELFPSQPMVYLLAGLGAIEIKKGSEALELLTAGKNYLLDEKNLKAEFEYQIGRAHFLDENYDQSFNSFEKAIKIEPNNPTFLNNYAYKLALRKKDLLKALELVRKAVDLVPENASYEDTYGWVLFQMGKYTECIEWLSSAIEHNPNSPDLHEHYGDALYKVNVPDQALKSWKKAKELGGDSDLLDKKIKTKKYHEK